MKQRAPFLSAHARYWPSVLEFPESGPATGPGAGPGGGAGVGTGGGTGGGAGVGAGGTLPQRPWDMLMSSRAISPLASGDVMAPRVATQVNEVTVGGIFT